MKIIRFIAIAVFGTAFCLAASSALISARGETHVRLNKEPAETALVPDEAAAGIVAKEHSKIAPDAPFTAHKGKLTETEIKQLLQQVDVHNIISSNTDSWQKIYNGFTGKDNYRVEFY